MMDTQNVSTAEPVSPWLTVKDAAARARCGQKIIRRAASLDKLRHATINERGDLRFRAEWIDAWLEQTATPIEVLRGAAR